MSTEELQVIREFLEDRAIGYKIASDGQYDCSSHWIKSGDVWEYYGESLERVLEQSLNHYLSTQLGIHWRKARAKRNHWENFLWAISLDREIEKQIGSAVTYLEKLEKGETE